MKKYSYVVKVPKPQQGSYDPQRKITGLVQNQLFHFRLAERQLPEEHRSGMDLYAIDTEAKAAAYIGHLTAKLHIGGGKKTGGAEESESARAERKEEKVKTGKTKRS